MSPWPNPQSLDQTCAQRGVGAGMDWSSASTPLGAGQTIASFKL